jgi:hypothetical protein
MKNLLLCTVTLLLLSCGSDSAQPASGEKTPDEACDQSYRVLVMVTDAWGRPIDAVVDVNGGESCADSQFSACFRPDGSLPVELTLTSQDHLDATLQASLSADGSAAPVETYVMNGTAWCASGYKAGDSSCPDVLLSCGLSHPWFADTGRPPSNNQVRVFLSGEELFGTLYDDLQTVQDTIHAASWWWQSNFELIRPDNHVSLSDQQRHEISALGVMDSKQTAFKRVMVGQFASMTAQGLAYLNTDTALRVKVYDQDDPFEVIIQPNPVDVPIKSAYEPLEHPLDYVGRLVQANPDLAEVFGGDTQTQQQALLETADAASWHQKCWALDGRIAYISGMNVKSTDWDTEQHLVFDERRMKFKSTLEERLAVKEKKALPDLGPRKDAGIRIEGPAAADVDQILGTRWDWGIAMNHMFSGFANPFPDLFEVDEPAEGIPVQVVATMPEPFGERSILESLDKAFRNAQDLIYIEDQYWRVPLLLPAIEEALTNHPDLCIIVATKPVSELDGAKKWTVEMDDALKEIAGDRYLLVHMRVTDTGHPDSGLGRVWQEMDIHTKMTVVDRVYFSVGSANKNNRGLLYEGELNATVLDEDTVSKLRQRILVNASGDSSFDWAAASGCEVLARLQEIATSNEALELDHQEGLRLAEEPQGFVQPLTIPPGYLLEIGPDAF